MREGRCERAFPIRNTGPNKPEFRLGDEVGVQAERSRTSCAGCTRPIPHFPSPISQSLTPIFGIFKVIEQIEQHVTRIGQGVGVLLAGGGLDRVNGGAERLVGGIGGQDAAAPRQ